MGGTIDSIISWGRELFGSSRAGLAPTGCVAPGEEESLCAHNQGKPQYTEYTPNGTPNSNYPYGDPDRPTVTWRISGVTNCDGLSTDGMSFAVSRGDVAAELQANGAYTLTIGYRFEDDHSDDPDRLTVTVTGSNGRSIDFVLYPPYGAEPTNVPPIDTCDSWAGPSIDGVIESSPPVSAAEVYQTMIFSVPLDAVVQCDGLTGEDADNSLIVNFKVDNEDVGAWIDDASGNYFITVTFNEPGNHRVSFSATDASRPDAPSARIDTGWFWVADPTGVAGAPPASIVAPFSAEVGAEVEFLCPSADEMTYSYTWDFVDGSPIEPGAVVYHSFANPGTYQVRLIVASLADPDNYTLVTQNITIVPVGVATPALSIVAPEVVNVGAVLFVTLGSPDEANFTYSWDMGDGTLPVSGSSAYHVYTGTGSYGVRVTATSIADPLYSFLSPLFYIYAAGESQSVPNLSLTAPWAGLVGSSVNFRAAAPSLSHFAYSIDVGDSTGEIAGADVFYAYPETGTYSVRLIARLLADPSVQYVSNPHFISIGTAPVPMPVLTSAHNPPSGPGSGYHLDFDASGSYSPIGAAINTYEIIYGDSGSAVGGSNSTGLFSHAYPNPGSGNTALYNVSLRIIDEYGGENTATLQITVWGD